jgi:Zn finger protein HypA/HybF involved in hydrogenase expression
MKMDKKVICEDCDARFEFANLKRKDNGVYICPNCKSDNLDWLKNKKMRARAIIEDGYLLCPKCKQKLVHITSLKDYAIRGADKDDLLQCPECEEEFNPLYEGDILIGAELK